MSKHKIAHINLCGLVTEGLQYQDNLLLKYHNIMGFKTYMITSIYSQNKFGKAVKEEKTHYFNDYGVETFRLREDFFTRLSKRFKRYPGLKQLIKSIKPDILFVHGVQFINLITIRKYLINNPDTFLYIDNHADFSNSGKNFFSYLFFHKILWRYNSKLIKKYVTRFYGVLPARVEYLKNVYGIPEKNIKLLRLGADDEIYQKVYDNHSSKEIIISGLDSTKKIIVSGGKFDYSKTDIIHLIKAVENHEDFQLIIFGSISKEIKNLVKIDNKKHTFYVGWREPEEVYQYFKLADIIAFPGRHSVLWENAIVFKKPMILKYWPGVTHLNVNDNVLFAKQSTYDDYNDILSYLSIESNYTEIVNKAEKSQTDAFFYSNIAKSSVSEFLHDNS